MNVSRETHRLAMVERIDAATAAGTHSHIFTTLCDGCRQWVDSIWLIVPGSKVRLCPKCADKAGQGPEALAAKLARQKGSIQ